MWLISQKAGKWMENMDHLFKPEGKLAITEFIWVRSASHFISQMISFLLSLCYNKCNKQSYSVQIFLLKFARVNF